MKQKERQPKQVKKARNARARSFDQCPTIGWFRDIKEEIRVMTLHSNTRLQKGTSAGQNVIRDITHNIKITIIASNIYMTDVISSKKTMISKINIDK